MIDKLILVQALGELTEEVSRMLDLVDGIDTPIEVKEFFGLGSFFDDSYEFGMKTEGTRYLFMYCVLEQDQAFNISFDLSYVPKWVTKIQMIGGMGKV